MNLLRNCLTPLSFIFNSYLADGDIRTHRGATEAFMKQKHRLIWERRNPDKKLH